LEKCRKLCIPSPALENNSAVKIRGHRAVNQGRDNRGKFTAGKVEKTAEKSKKRGRDDSEISEDSTEISTVVPNDVTKGLISIIICSLIYFLIYIDFIR
jgi:hypothetical protein